MLRPLQVLKLIALLLRPQQSPTTAHLSVSVSAPVSASMSASGSDSEPAAKKTKQCVSRSPGDVVAPLGTSTTPPRWLELGHALRIIDELKKRRRGGDTPR